jgi:hypothetical protein
MRRTPILFIILLLGVTEPLRAQQFDNTAFCAEVKRVARSMYIESPMWAEAVTRHDGMSVSCISKLIEYKKFVNGRTDGRLRLLRPLLMGSSTA